MKTELKNVSKNYDRDVKNLKRVYTNKSCDEYKMKGDITKHPLYDILSKDIPELGNGVKNIPTKTVIGIKDMFASLKKPIWKKMIPEFMAKPNPKNTIYSMYFSIGFRTMMTALMFIQTNIKASENGLEYVTPKIRENDKNILDFVSKNGKDYDKFVEKTYQSYEKNSKKATKVSDSEEKKENKKDKVETESYVVTQESVSAVTAVADKVVGIIEGVFGVLNSIFKTAASLNPISLISACLSRSYDKKIEQYDKVSKELAAAKQAYDEYKKIPAAQRKKRIESNYVKMIDKYNIKMANLKAKIDHYDTRATKGSDDDDDTDKNNVSKSGDKDLPDSSSTVDTSKNKRDDLDF